MKKDTAGRAIFYILIAVFAASEAYLLGWFWRSHSQQVTYRGLSAGVEAARQAGGEEKGQGILPEYREPYRQNPDLVGWVRIPGTAIDYPVVQSPYSPGYYLTHDFYGAENSWGCIYLAEGCDPASPGDNLILYGHHMADGSMFAGLMDYRSPDFREANPRIFFDTLGERRTYRIFAVFAVDPEEFPYHRFVSPADEEEFAGFVAECRSRSFYDTGILPVWGDELLCLSTCEYSRENGRLVVAAVREG